MPSAAERSKEETLKGEEGRRRKLGGKGQMGEKSGGISGLTVAA